MLTNINIIKISYLKLLISSFKLTQQISTIFIFVRLFLYFYYSVGYFDIKLIGILIVFVTFVVYYSKGNCYF